MIKSITFKKGSLYDVVHASHPSLWHLDHLGGGVDFGFGLGVPVNVRGEIEIDPKELGLDKKKHPSSQLPYVALTLFQELVSPGGFICPAQESCFDNWMFSFWTLPESLHKKIDASWTWGRFYEEFLQGGGLAKGAIKEAMKMLGKDVDLKETLFPHLLNKRGGRDAQAA